MKSKTKTKLMGILNITPDSFSDGGKYSSIKNAIAQAEKLISRGVHIIDIGGESTRPGAIKVSEEEELNRVIPVVKEIAQLKSIKNFEISIDTYKSGVARKCLELGANYINDVSGLTLDKNMANTASEAACGLIIMHNSGIPATKPALSNERRDPKLLLEEIKDWLNKQTNYALVHGVKKENIIIDPGLGFGKSPSEDFYIIQNLNELKSLGYPVLIGPSRKSFLKHLFPGEDIEQKSKEIIELSIQNGADVIRIH